MLPLDEQVRFVDQQLAKLGGWLDLPGLAAYGAEIASDDALKSELETSVGPVDFFRTKVWDGMARLGLYRLAQYACTRAVRARCVVETGVLHGLSSVYTLAALERNALEGVADSTMISIDYPSTYEGGPSNRDGYHDTLPPGLGPGWLIPERLRSRWQLRIGPSREHLLAACRALGAVDVFVHDSEHTYETMMFEFETAWPWLRPGGVLIADNIDANTAFFDFARAAERYPHVMPVDPDHFSPGGSGIRFGVIRR